MKTVKFATKRLKLTKKGKVLFRPSGQNHFNAGQTGQQGRKKKGFNNLPKSEAKVFKKILER